MGSYSSVLGLRGALFAVGFVDAGSSVDAEAEVSISSTRCWRAEAGYLN